MRTILFAALALLLPALYAEDTIEMKVKVQGVLQKEGTDNQLVIEQDGWAFRLDFGKDKDMQQTAQQYLKRPIFVVGILSAVNNLPTLRVNYLGITVQDARFQEEHPLPTIFKREIFSF